MADLSKPIDDRQLIQAVKVYYCNQSHQNEQQLIDAIIKSVFILPLKGTIYRNQFTQTDYYYISDPQNQWHRYIMIFTSWKEVIGWEEYHEDIKGVLVCFADLFKILQRCQRDESVDGLIMNPFSNPLMINYLMANYIDSIMKSTKPNLLTALVCEPDPPPFSLMITLNALLQKYPVIEKAFLLCALEGFRKEYILILDCDGLPENAAYEIKNGVKKHLKNGESISLHTLDHEWAAKLVEGKLPVFTKINTNKKNRFTMKNLLKAAKGE